MTTSDPITLILWSATDDAVAQADAVLDEVAEWTRRPDRVAFVASRPPQHTTSDLSVTHVAPGSGKTIWDGIARAAGAVESGLIAFLEASRTPSDWLSQMASTATLPGTAAVGGDITIESESGVVPTSQQRAAISGWYGVSYVSLSNAAISANVLRRYGPLSPEFGALAAAPFCRRLATEADAVVRFAPEASIRLDLDIKRAWHGGVEAGSHLARWLEHTADDGQAATIEQPPVPPSSLARLEKILAADGADARAAVAELSAMTLTMATTLGLAAARRPVAAAAVPSAPRARSDDKECNICAGRSFIAGPGGRMVGKLGPQCEQCGSLERHRVMSDLLAAVPDAEARGLDVVLVGDGRPRTLARFRSHRHLRLPSSPVSDTRRADIVSAYNLFSGPNCSELAQTLEALISMVVEDGTVVLVERLDADGATRQRAAGGYSIGPDFGSLIAKMLPEVHVNAFPMKDRPTGEAFMVVVASATSAFGTLMAMRGQSELFNALKL